MITAGELYQSLFRLVKNNEDRKKLYQFFISLLNGDKQKAIFDKDNNGNIFIKGTNHTYYGTCKNNIILSLVNTILNNTSGSIIIGNKSYVSLSNKTIIGSLNIDVDYTQLSNYGNNRKTVKDLLTYVTYLTDDEWTTLRNLNINNSVLPAEIGFDFLDDIMWDINNRKYQINGNSYIYDINIKNYKYDDSYTDFRCIFEILFAEGIRTYYYDSNYIKRLS